MASHPAAGQDRESDPHLPRPTLPNDLKDFERIYKLYAPRVYRTCLRMVGNPADAEELSQEVFLQVFRKLDTYRGESAFSTWLHRVAVNVVLMRLRKERGYSEVPLEKIVQTEDGDAIETTRFGADDVSLLGTIDRLTLERAIVHLPVRQRLALVLHDVEGYTYEEIAEISDCSLESAKYHLHTARVSLRALLHEYRREQRRQAADSPAHQSVPAEFAATPAAMDRACAPETRPETEVSAKDRDANLPLAHALG